jgi:hypothetical protein
MPSMQDQTLWTMPTLPESKEEAKVYQKVT